MTMMRIIIAKQSLCRKKAVIDSQCVMSSVQITVAKVVAKPIASAVVAPQIKGRELSNGP